MFHGLVFASYWRKRHDVLRIGFLAGMLCRLYVDVMHY